MNVDLLTAAVLALYVSILIAFFWMAFNIAAIRRMLENQGLFSGLACRWCRMSVPEGAAVCGHCGRELVGVDAP